MTKLVLIFGVVACSEPRARCCARTSPKKWPSLNLAAFERFPRCTSLYDCAHRISRCSFPTAVRRRAEKRSYVQRGSTWRSRLPRDGVLQSSGRRMEVLGAASLGRAGGVPIAPRSEAPFSFQSSRRFFEGRSGQRLRIVVDAWPDMESMKAGGRSIQFTSPPFECPGLVSASNTRLMRDLGGPRRRARMPRSARFPGSNCSQRRTSRLRRLD